MSKSNNVDYSHGYDMKTIILMIIINIVVPIITIVYNSFIIYYLNNLEGSECGISPICTPDWRHQFIKWFSLTVIVLVLFEFIVKRFMFSTYGKYYQLYHKIMNIVIIILSLASIVNIYSIYTYVGDVTDNNCPCAADKQPIINKTLYIWRYVMVGGFILSFILSFLFFQMKSNQK